MVGIINLDDINVVGHSLFNNFRLAIRNYFQETLIDVNSSDDLHSVDLLIIVDEHFIPHKQIWKNESFINLINEKNIKVLIFNFEKIFNSQFPWNVDIQHSIDKINNKIQLVSDVKDVKFLNAHLNKQLLSRDTFLSEPNQNKIDEILFIGQVNEYYPNRNNILNSIQKITNKLKIIKTDRKYSYSEFINFINKTKYILNPLGTGEFINLRFYEALSLGCIVIQQYTDEMEGLYPELDQKNVLKFKTIEDFKNLDFNSVIACEESFLEDYFKEIDLIKIISNM